MFSKINVPRFATKVPRTILLHPCIQRRNFTVWNAGPTVGITKVLGLCSAIYVGCALASNLKDRYRYRWYKLERSLPRGTDAIVFGLLTLNVLATLAKGTMPRRMTSHPFNPLYTLVTSQFSHTDLMHLAFNSIALYSFGPALIRRAFDGDSFHFLGVYLIGGTLSSFAYNTWALRLLKTRGSPIIPACGASGALCTMVSLLAYLFPNSPLTLIFFPFVSIPASWAVGGLAAYDTWSLVTHRATNVAHAV